MFDEVKDAGKTAAEQGDGHLTGHEHLRVGKVPCVRGQELDASNAVGESISVDALTGDVLL